MVKRGVEAILDGISLDWKQDPNLRDTPRRFVSALSEYIEYNDLETDTELMSTYPTQCNTMVIQKNIRAIGLCPHHLQPIEFTVHIGYIPKARAVGLSKLVRVAQSVFRRLDIQESNTRYLADLIGEKLMPRGVIVVARGIHGCIKFRGVRQEHAEAITSAVTGVFRDPEELARQEFLSLITGGNHNGV